MDRDQQKFLAKPKVRKLIATIQGNKGYAKAAPLNLSHISNETEMDRKTIRTYLLKLVEYDLLTNTHKGFVITDKFPTGEEIPQSTEEFTQSDEETPQSTEEFTQYGGEITQSDEEFPQSTEEFPQPQNSSHKTAQKGISEQHQACLESLNLMLSVIRYTITKTSFGLDFEDDMEEEVRSLWTGELKDFLYTSKAEQFNPDTDARLIDAFAHLVKLVAFRNEGVDAEERQIFEEKHGKTSKSFQEECRGFTERMEAKAAEKDEDDDVAEEWEDEYDEPPTALRKPKIIERERGAACVEFTPDEVEDILAKEADFSKSPLKVLIYNVWYGLHDMYHEEFKDNQMTKDNKDFIDNFRLEDALVDPDVLYDMMAEVYEDIVGAYDSGEADLDGETIEVDWTGVPLFDQSELRRIFNWKKVSTSLGGQMYVPSTLGIMNLEKEAVKKPTRPEGRRTDEWHEASRRNAMWITEVLRRHQEEVELGKRRKAGSGEEWVPTLNVLERRIAGFITRYYDTKPHIKFDGLVMLERKPYNPEMGAAAQASVDGYVHHENLNELYKSLASIGVTPQDFQWCLMNPAKDNSYHSMIRLQTNMFWAEGIAYICAQKGLQSTIEV